MARTVKTTQGSGRTAPLRNWKRGQRRAWKQEKNNDPSAPCRYDWWWSPNETKWVPSLRMMDALPEERWLDMRALRQQRSTMLAGYALRRSERDVRLDRGDGL